LIKKRKGKSPQDSEVFLFDLKKDLGESNNLASQKAKIVSKMKNRMIQVDEEITKNARTPWFME
jgi:hypothetical protein